MRPRPFAGDTIYYADLAGTAVCETSVQTALHLQAPCRHIFHDPFTMANTVDMKKTKTLLI